MLLYVFKDGTARTVQDNPSTGDILGVVSGILDIFKATPEGYKKLTLKNNKIFWVTIKKSITISCKDGKVQM
jgi:hypothetical protein